MAVAVQFSHALLFFLRTQHSINIFPTSVWFLGFPEMLSDKGGITAKGTVIRSSQFKEA